MAECIKMAMKLSGLKAVVGVEFNPSCPNRDSDFCKTPDLIVTTCAALCEVSEHPIILKLRCYQPYFRLASRTEKFVEAITINSVPWQAEFRDKPSPLAEYGGGGLSGLISRPFNWKMVQDLSKTMTPVIGPCIWDYEDMILLARLGASAFQFGTIFMLQPWRPSAYVRRWQRENAR